MPQCDSDCLYEWTDHWVMIDGCETGCECEHPPSYQGSPGNIVTVPCNPEESAAPSTGVTGIGLIVWAPWYSPGDEKHSVMRHTEQGWRYYYYGPNRSPKIQPQSELLLPYPVGSLLVIGNDSQILGIGMLGQPTQ